MKKEKNIVRNTEKIIKINLKRIMKKIKINY